MADQVQIRRRSDGEYELGRSGSDTTLVISAEQVIGLANLLPALVDQIARSPQPGPGAGSAVAVSSPTAVRRVTTNHDEGGQTVFLHLTDKDGLQSSFAFPRSSVKRLAEALRDSAESAEKAAAKPPVRPATTAAAPTAAAPAAEPGRGPDAEGDAPP